MRAAAEVGTGVVVDNCATVLVKCCYYMGLNADPDYRLEPEVPGCGGVETGIFVLEQEGTLRNRFGGACKPFDYIY